MEERPGEIATQIDALLNRRMSGTEMRVIVGNPLHIINPALWINIVMQGYVTLGYVQGKSGIFIIHSNQQFCQSRGIDANFPSSSRPKRATHDCATFAVY